MIFSPDAQSKFVHTSIAGYVTAAIFVAGVSAFYMLKKRHMELAKRSFRMAALYGVMATIGVITLGDALGFVAAQAQPTKLAAMEGLWKSEAAPMPFNLIAFPDQARQDNKGAVQIPYLLSLLVTHSIDGTVEGVDTLERQATRKIENGIPAVQALKTLSKGSRGSGGAGAIQRAREGSRLRLSGAALRTGSEQRHPGASATGGQGHHSIRGVGVLVVPPDGRLRPADAGVLRAGGAVHAAQQGAGQALVPDRGGVDDPGAIPRQ
ncbi:cytochrome D ubiquinol oxidase subunit I [mine drainage metagenome]|uniref:Cytochrome D ubiquinol oxidase subunit I n=1 Tax=mine drainage metagenome TaxID=410659 RepID=T1ANR7_9ZZZZ